MSYVFFMTGRAKTKAGKRAPEDKYQSTPLLGDDGTLDRWTRQTNNDLECIPMGVLVIILSTVVCTGSLFDDTPRIVHIIATSLFVAARVCFTICYAMALSMPRSVCWFVGQLSILTLLIQSLVLAFKYYA
jgi:uncharacterized MAPEG superfamily protein